MRPFPKIFLLTRLSRGATKNHKEEVTQLTISTHAPLARRDLQVVYIHATKWISTHAPLARRDVVSIGYNLNRLTISTHAPLARRDASRCYMAVHQRKFLLTRLSRGATYCFILPLPLTSDFYSRASREARLAESSLSFCQRYNFYSRASREARREGVLHLLLNFTISTHAPLARRDLITLIY